MKEDVNLDSLSQEAEKAMYLAKHGGRNQVASLDHEPITISSRQTRN